MKYKVQRAISIYNQRGFKFLVIKIFSLIRSLLFLPFQLVVYSISKIAPRDETIWIFGYGQGKEFTDNSKHLFLHAAENTDKKAIWLTKNKNVVNNVGENFNCFSFYSLKGIYYALRSEYAFICNTRKDIPWIFTGGSKIVMLQHGIPVATTYWDNDSQISKLGFIKKRLNKHIFLNFDYSLASSEFMQEYVCKYCDLDRNHVFVTGMPRMDMFHNPEYDYSVGSEKTLDKLDQMGEEKNLIMYSPTWSKNSESSIDIETIERLDKLMDEANSILIVKPHRNDELNAKSGKYRNTVFLEQNTDFYPIFLELDLLITNYSSIFWDALYADIPIIFHLPDNLKGIKYETMYFDYESLPGKHTCSLNELEDCIRQTTSYESSPDSEKINEWKNKVFKFKTGQNCDRIVEIFDSGTN